MVAGGSLAAKEVLPDIFLINATEIENDNLEAFRALLPVDIPILVLTNSDKPTTTTNTLSSVFMGSFPGEECGIII